MNTKKSPFPARDAAETLAIEALGWLAGQPEALGRFLALAGIGPQSLRLAAAEPQFLAGVLDFFMGEEPLLVAFATQGGFTPQAIAHARAVLAGSDEVL